MRAVSVIFALCLIAVQVFAGLEGVPLDALIKQDQAKRAERQETRATCYSITCANQGQSCNSTNSNQIICANANDYCDTYNTPETLTCLAQVAVGGACVASDQCLDSYCSSGKCTAYTIITLKANGQTCSDDFDCQSDQCTSGTCQGSAIGAACSNSQNCNIGGVTGSNYCNGAGVCAVPILLNAKCSSTDHCAYGLVCDTLGAGNCVPYFSLGSGAKCSIDDQCGDALACYTASGASTKTCQTVPSPSNAKCSANSDCTAANEGCLCSAITGSGVCVNVNYPANTAGLSAVSAAITACYNGPCASDQTSTCALAKCTKGYCNYYTIENANTAAYNTRFPTCAQDSATTVPSQCSKTSGAAVAVASFAVVAVAAAALL